MKIVTKLKRCKILQGGGEGGGTGTGTGTTGTQRSISFPEPRSRNLTGTRNPGFLRVSPLGDSECLPKSLGDNTAVPFWRAGVVLYPHPFSSLVRTLKTKMKTKNILVDYKIRRAFFVRTPLSANNSTSKSGPMSRSFRPFWDFKFVGLFYQEGFKLY